ncbi:hypothetical protein BHM03_00033376 [Ensete ventricosum]|nr:hypothetical protein BHM03_00033376 [Ensete ventricosum]
MGGGSTMRTGPLKRGTGGADEVDPVLPHPVVDCGFGFGFGFLHKIRDNCIVSYLYPTHGSRKIKQGASILDKWLEYKGFPIRGHTKGHDDECHLVSMFVKRGVYSSASSTRTAPYAGSGQRRGGNGENTKQDAAAAAAAAISFPVNMAAYVPSLFGLHHFQRASSFHLNAPLPPQ